MSIKGSSSTYPRALIDTNLPNIQPVTHAGWTRTSDSGAGYWGIFFNRMIDYGDEQPALMFNSSSKILRIWHGGGVNGSYVWSANEWHYLVYLRTVRNENIVYMLDIDTEPEIYQVATGNQGTFNQMELCGGWGAYGEPMSFCHFKMWEAELSVGELLQEMKSAGPRRTKNLYGYWPFRDSDDLWDYSGHGHHFEESGTLIHDIQCDRVAQYGPDFPIGGYVAVGQEYQRAIDGTLPGMGGSLLRDAAYGRAVGGDI